MKYGNKKVEYNGELFDSESELNRYLELRLLEKAHKINDLRRQVPFVLIPPQYGERGVKYVADFTYTENEKMIVEDVKGYATKEYILKRKMFKDKYYTPGGEIEFREIKRWKRGGTNGKKAVKR